MIKNVTIGDASTNILTAPDGELYTLGSLYLCNHSDSSETITVHACARNESASDTNAIVKDITIPSKTTFKIGVDRDLRSGKIRDQKLLVENGESIKAKAGSNNSRITATATYAQAFTNSFNNSKGSITLSKACDLNFSDVHLLIQSDTRQQADPIVDISDAKKSVEIKGNTVYHSVNAAKFGASSLFFDGASYLQVGNDAKFYDTTASTWECWFNTNSPSVQYLAAANGAQHYWGISIDPSTNIIRAGGNVNGSSISNNRTGHAASIPNFKEISIELNKWYHIAFVKSGSGDAELYFNGESIDSTSSFTSSDEGFDHKDYITIGSQRYNQDYAAARYLFNGFIEDVRFSHVRRYN